jgi:hypothetical protein
MRLRSTPPDAALVPLMQAVAKADERAADAEGKVKTLTEEVQALKAKVTVQVDVEPGKGTPAGPVLTAAGLLAALKNDPDFQAAVAAGKNKVTPQQLLDAMKADKSMQPVFAKAQEPALPPDVRDAVTKAAKDMPQLTGQVQAMNQTVADLGAKTLVPRFDELHNRLAKLENAMVRESAPQAVQVVAVVSKQPNRDTLYRPALARFFESQPTSSDHKLGFAWLHGQELSPGRIKLGTPAHGVTANQFQLPATDAQYSDPDLKDPKLVDAILAEIKIGTPQGAAGRLVLIAGADFACPVAAPQAWAAVTEPVDVILFDAKGAADKGPNVAAWEAFVRSKRGVAAVVRDEKELFHTLYRLAGPVPKYAAAAPANK